MLRLSNIRRLRYLLIFRHIGLIEATRFCWGGFLVSILSRRKRRSPDYYIRCLNLFFFFKDFFFQIFIIQRLYPTTESLVCQSLNYFRTFNPDRINSLNRFLDFWNRLNLARFSRACHPRCNRFIRSFVAAIFHTFNIRKEKNVWNEFCGIERMKKIKRKY